MWDIWHLWSQVEKAANIRRAKFAHPCSSNLPGYDDDDYGDGDDDDEVYDDGGDDVWGGVTIRPI